MFVAHICIPTQERGNEEEMYMHSHAGVWERGSVLLSKSKNL